MARAWDAAFNSAVDEIANVRRDLANFDARVLAMVGSERDSVFRARASTHVWLAAVMERFVGDWLVGICTEFNALGIRWCDVRLSLFSIACGSEIQSIADGVRKGAWPRRVAMFTKVSEALPAILDASHVPLDGKTIRPSHLDDIGAVFGFDQNLLPSPLHRAILGAVADYRNDIAHGKERPAIAGSRFAYSDYMRHVTRFEDMVEHIAIESENYFLRGKYLR